MKTNYHTHTTRCNHAVGSDEAYVISAIKAGFSEIGFADHTPWPYRTKFESPMRMNYDELEDYLRSIRHLKEKYAAQISIKIGLECEYFPSYMNWLKQLLDSGKVDYLIFGNHFHQSDEHGCYYGRAVKDEKTLRLYVDDAIAGMETGLYAYLCHPDLFMRAYQRWDDVAIAQSLRLCEAAKRLNIPLEYNLQGVFFKERYKDEFGYPYHPFWQLAATVGNQVMIGIDAHRNTEYEMVEYYERAQAYLNQLGVEVLTHLPQKQGR